MFSGLVILDSVPLLRASTKSVVRFPLPLRGMLMPLVLVMDSLEGVTTVSTVREGGSLILHPCSGVNIARDSTVPLYCRQQHECHLPWRWPLTGTPCQELKLTLVPRGRGKMAQ